jgi:hypothetical protein
MADAAADGSPCSPPTCGGSRGWARSPALLLPAAGLAGAGAGVAAVGQQQQQVDPDVGRCRLAPRPLPAFCAPSGSRGSSSAGPPVPAPQPFAAPVVLPPHLLLFRSASIGGVGSSSSSATPGQLAAGGASSLAAVPQTPSALHQQLERCGGRDSASMRLYAACIMPTLSPPPSLSLQAGATAGSQPDTVRGRAARWRARTAVARSQRHRRRHLAARLWQGSAPSGARRREQHRQQQARDVPNPTLLAAVALALRLLPLPLPCSVLPCALPGAWMKTIVRTRWK